MDNEQRVRETLKNRTAGILCAIERKAGDYSAQSTFGAVYALGVADGRRRERFDALRAEREEKED